MGKTFGRPYGTRRGAACFPSAEALGYFRLPLRDTTGEFLAKNPSPGPSPTGRGVTGAAPCAGNPFHLPIKSPLSPWGRGRGRGSSGAEPHSRLDEFASGILRGYTRGGRAAGD